MTVAKRQRSEDLIDLGGLVFGTHIRGALPAGFQPYLWSPLDDPADRRRLIEVSYRTVCGLPAVEEIWVAEPGPETIGRFALFREPGGIGLTVSGQGTGLFRLTAGAIAIDWSPEGAGAAHYFFSHALPLWLESRGVPVLHASAVSFSDRAVAFVGGSGVGKSTLCAGLVRSGCHFVADDGLPLFEDEQGEWRCAHGPPLFKLWPTALEDRLGVPAGHLPRVHEGLEKRLLPSPRRDSTDPATGLEVATVYVLERQPEDSGGVTSTACTARESLVLLIEHSLAGGPLAALGLSAQRLERLARLAARTPVRRLRYPTGGDSWRLVRQAILKDLSATGTAVPPRP